MFDIEHNCYYYKSDINDICLICGTYLDDEDFDAYCDYFDDDFDESSEY